MFSNQTQQNLGTSITVAVYTAVSLQTLSKVLPRMVQAFQSWAIKCSVGLQLHFNMMH